MFFILAQGVERHGQADSRPGRQLRPGRPVRGRHHAAGHGGVRVRVGRPRCQRYGTSRGARGSDGRKKNQ